MSCFWTKYTWILIDFSLTKWKKNSLAKKLSEAKTHKIFCHVLSWCCYCWLETKFKWIFALIDNGFKSNVYQLYFAIAWRLYRIAHEISIAWDANKPSKSSSNSKMRLSHLHETRLIIISFYMRTERARNRHWLH